jgi:hypothetical protein
VPKTVVAAFLIAMVLVNVRTMSAPAISAARHRVAERNQRLHEVLEPRSLVAVLNNQDELYQLNTHTPADLMTIAEATTTWWDIVEPLNERVPRWKADLGAHAAKAWDGQGAFWISKRLWAPRPRPEWYWAEGDDPRIAWKDLPLFFNQLDVDGEVQEDDGFYRIPPTAKNRRLFGNGDR